MVASHEITMVQLNYAYSVGLTQRVLHVLTHLCKCAMWDLPVAVYITQSCPWLDQIVGPLMELHRCWKFGDIQLVGPTHGHARSFVT